MSSADRGLIKAPYGFFDKNDFKLTPPDQMKNREDAALISAGRNAINTNELRDFIDALGLEDALCRYQTTRNSPTTSPTVGT